MWSNGWGTSRLFRPRFAQSAERRKQGRAMDQAISNDIVILERAMGFEPTTPTLAR